MAAILLLLGVKQIYNTSKLYSFYQISFGAIGYRKWKAVQDIMIVL